VEEQGRLSMNPFEMKYSELVSEFDRYVLEHPEFAEQLPKDAHIVLQVEGDKALNEWARRVAEKNAEEGHPIVYVKIKKLEPIRSRIAELELERV
jgi:hypothetical protein